MRSVFYPHLVNGPFGDPALYVRIAHRGAALLFDSGELHALTTRELLKIQAVFISHGHIDHLVGFDQLLRTFLYQDRVLLVCGPAGLADQVAARLQGYTWNLIEGYPLVLQVREWDGAGCRQVTFRAGDAFRPGEEERWPAPDGVLLATPDFTVRGVPLAHGEIVSLAYALEETLHVAIHKDALEAGGFSQGPWLTRFKDLVRRGEDEATLLSVPMSEGPPREVSLGSLLAQIAHCERGMKLVYVTDAGPSPENRDKIVSLARDAHLLAIEAVFADADRGRAHDRQHLTAKMAGELARCAAVAKLLVFHHSPRYRDRPEMLGEEAWQAFRGRGE